MGNLLDKMGDGAAATQAFAVYRALSPRGDFAEDALVRELRSAVNAGKQDLARRLVHQYEVDFPEGRQADEVARWAEQIPTQSEPGDAGVALSESAQ
jgi:TolA-binding protein